MLFCFLRKSTCYNLLRFKLEIVSGQKDVLTYVVWGLEKKIWNTWRNCEHLPQCSRFFLL